MRERKVTMQCESRKLKRNNGEKTMKKSVLLVATMFLTVAVLMSASYAAPLLTGELTIGTATSQNLTALDGLDWRLWNETDDEWGMDGMSVDEQRFITASVYNEKSGGSAIGNLVADFTKRHDTRDKTTSLSPGHTYTYSDGVAPASETGLENIGVGIRGQWGQFSDRRSDYDTLSFEVTTASDLEHTLVFFGANQYMDTTLTLSLPGVADLDVFVQGVDGHQDWYYTATFTPETVGDILTVTVWRDFDDNSTNANNTANYFLLGGAAVHVIPEPSTLALLGLAGLALLKRRRV